METCLTTQGVEEGSVVAVFMKNSLAFIEISFAVSHLGAVFLPVNYRLARSEADYFKQVENFVYGLPQGNISDVLVAFAELPKASV